MQFGIVVRSYLSFFLVVLFLIFASSTVYSFTASVNGAIAGQHNVGNDGSAQYSIPLNAPGGIQGMRPEIALSYSSNGGNSVVGVGFDIGGLSSIQRCETTIERDGFADGVDFDDNDQYCLDGQRLVAVSGEYGDVGTEYRTVNDSITKIISYGSEGNLVDGISEFHAPLTTGRNPQWFKVWTQDGRIYEYGNTTDSRSSFPKNFSFCPQGYVFYTFFTYSGYLGMCYNFTTGASQLIGTITETRTYEWSVNKVSDRYDNRMVYSYEGGSSEKRIQRINYNFLNSGTASAQNSIRFSYQPRPDTATGFYASTPVIQTQRLSKVAAYSGAQELRALIPEYGNNTATGDSVITKVWECSGGSSSNCTKPTAFIWEGGAAGFAATAISSGNNANGWDDNPLVLDVNGDGRMDIALAEGSSWSVMLSNGEKYATQVYTSASTAGKNTAKVFRYNDDSSDDILIAQSGTWRILKGGYQQEITVNISLGGEPFPVTFPAGPTLTTVDTGITAEGVDTAQLIDINGDGLKDLLYKVGSGVYVRYLVHNQSTGVNTFSATPEATNIPASYLNSDTKIADMNGDGLEDLVVRLSGAASETPGIYYSQGAATTFKWYQFGYAQDAYATLKLLDFNGDGLLDVLVRNSISSYIVQINNGQSLESAQSVYGLNALTDTQWATAVIYDYNADGRDDVMYGGGSGAPWKLLISNGTVFSSLHTNIVATGWDRNPIVSDMTGNGMGDLTLNIGNLWQTRPHNSLRPDYLTRITNGMGVKTEFDYRFLTDPTDPDFYERGGNATYPVINVQNSSYLVSEVRQSNGWQNNDMNSSSYSYKNLQIHQRGLGNFGFEEITIKNNDTGIETRSTFSQDYENHKQGTLLNVVTKSGATVLSETSNTWQVDTLCGAGKGVVCSMHGTDPS